jgi:hypothetical protein
MVKMKIKLDKYRDTQMDLVAELMELRQDCDEYCDNSDEEENDHEE